MAHLSHKIDIVNLMSHLDPDSPWGNTRQTRERYLHSMWESEFQLNELASILQGVPNKREKGLLGVKQANAQSPIIRSD